MSPEPAPPATFRPSPPERRRVPGGPAAGAAEALRAAHERAVVGAQLDGRRPRRLREARPAGPGFELGGGVEQRRSARAAMIGAVCLVEHILPREGRLGGCTPQ